MEDTTRKRRFFYHYNKPASRKAGLPILTLHWQNKCHQVYNIKCQVDTETHSRKQQPHCIVRGWAKYVHIDDVGKAVIYNHD